MGTTVVHSFNSRRTEGPSEVSLSYKNSPTSVRSEPGTTEVVMHIGKRSYSPFPFPSCECVLTNIRKQHCKLCEFITVVEFALNIINKPV